MTNKEAIRRIREHMIIHKLNEPRAIHISEALDRAIKALDFIEENFPKSFEDYLNGEQI